MKTYTAVQSWDDSAALTRPSSHILHGQTTGPTDPPQGVLSPTVQSGGSPKKHHPSCACQYRIWHRPLSQSVYAHAGSFNCSFSSVSSPVSWKPMDTAAEPDPWSSQQRELQHNWSNPQLIHIRPAPSRVSCAFPVCAVDWSSLHDILFSSCTRQ